MENDMISKYFSWHEALWLPQWNRYANAFDGLTPEIEKNLKELFDKMDVVREFFQKPIIVHCAYRPEVYNELVKGAPGSAHKTGKAIDFHVKDMMCENSIGAILANKKLDEWNLRMENNGPSPGWIHLGNDWQEGHDRYFKP